MDTAVTLQQIVTGGLCIGCGLCQSIAGTDRVEMVMTPEGRERPRVKQDPAPADLALINAVCPGLTVNGPDPADAPAEHRFDEMWGPVGNTVRGYAGDPDIRFRAAAGGGLTGLATYLLEAGIVERVAHVKADPDRPMRSVATVSETAEEVLNASGSRYGPAAPLVDFMALLDEGKPFAFVGKPCDVDAIHALQQRDPRAAALCKVKLSLVCGGASELTKSAALLARHGMEEEDVTLFRYRGYGNPGLTRIEARDGRAVHITYGEMWDDEGTWQLQFRCKICPDPIGEHADIAVLDCWPGGGPTGEDAGFNAFVTRTKVGDTVFDGAVESGAIVVTNPVTVRDLDDFQPHQVRKKRALHWRLQAMREKEVLTPRFENLRIESFAFAEDDEGAERNRTGMHDRIDQGKTSEPLPRSGTAA